MARHPEVDDQGAVLKIDQKIFAAPPDVQDAAAFQQRGQTGREGPAQSFATANDVLDDAAFEMGRDAAPGNFDFWEFRHA
ncbi:hypothetical protein GCM10009094_02310 [Massilia aurea]